MYRGNDSVFRFSLIGIAFILVFCLLIVFSGSHSGVDVERTQVRIGLDKHMQDLAQQAFESTWQEFQSKLSEKGVDASQILDKAKAEAENATLKQLVQEQAAKLGEQKAQLEGFTAVRKVLTHASRTPVLDGTSTEALVSAFELRERLEQEFLSMSNKEKESKLADSEIASRALAAIHFKRNIETLVKSELGGMSSLVPGQEPAWERWLILDSQLFKSVREGLFTCDASRETDSRLLRAQINFLRDRQRTETSLAPPCWYDSEGNVQFLLAIELHTGNPVKITAKPAWLPVHKASALAIPGVNELLALTNSQIPYPSFLGSARVIAQHSDKQWCRHSVQVTDNLRSGKRSEEIHKELEKSFHLMPVPR